MSGKITGGCACGAIRYDVTAEPYTAYCCHCNACQKRSVEPVVQRAGRLCERLGHVLDHPGTHQYVALAGIVVPDPVAGPPSAFFLEPRSASGDSQ